MSYTKPAQPLGLVSSAQLGQADPERAAFARWCRENGHGELDDMLTPLDRSLRALMWPVWLGAVAAERERCAKIVDVPPGTEAWEVIGGEEGLTMLRELAAQIRGA